MTSTAADVASLPAEQGPATVPTTTTEAQWWRPAVGPKLVLCAVSGALAPGPAGTPVLGAVRVTGEVRH
jgi:hypothetical protein